MALACQCDRCKNYFSTNDHGIVTSVIIKKRSMLMSGDCFSDKTDVYDLCDSCLGEVLKCMKKYEGRSSNAGIL